MGPSGNPNPIATTLARALELSEGALEQITRVAIEEIRGGLETSSHIEAAERDMRNALRQLVMAEREIASTSASRLGADGRLGADARTRHAETTPGSRNLDD